MLTTTLALLHKYRACEDRYKLLACELGGIQAYDKNTPIPLLKILETNGLDDALWAFRACTPVEEAEREARLLMCDYAEHVLPRAWDSRFPDDKRPWEAVAVARRFAQGEATEQELSTAEAAARGATKEVAWDEYWAADKDAIWNAARVAAENAAWAATWVATKDAARATIKVVAWAAASGIAATTVRAGAWASAWAAAEADERKWQAARLREVLEEGNLNV